MPKQTPWEAPLVASRRQFIKHVPIGALLVTLESNALGLIALPRQARAAAQGQIIDAFTQEAVNFNPLLYVNTGMRDRGGIQRLRCDVED